jgi:uncharacterized protein YjbI with pentapeptide repeats
MVEPLAPHPPRRDVRTAMTFAELDLDETAIELGDFSRSVLAPGEYRLVDWEGCEFNGCSLASTSWVKSHFSDTIFMESDVANVVLDQSGLQRVMFERVRLTGFSAGGCPVQNVMFRDCLADLSAWRFANLERVRFESCRLTKTDWTSARLKHVTFDNCDLTEADFNHAELESVRFRGCTFDGIQGVTGLRGATLDAANLIDLTVAMATALGITAAAPEHDAGSP